MLIQIVKNNLIVNIYTKNVFYKLINIHLYLLIILKNYFKFKILTFSQ